MCNLGNSLDKNLKPVNIAAVKGEGVTLDCPAEDDMRVNWIVIKYGSHDQDYIRDSPNGLYSIKESADKNSKLLFNSSEETAGTYSCFANVKNSHSSEMIMLGKFSCVQFRAKYM